MIAILNRICAPALAVALVAGLSVTTFGTAYATQAAKSQSSVHMVFCQKTGAHITITKGSSSSDNKNRTQVGTWDEHERGEGWNQARVELEFGSKCNTTEPTQPTTPVTPPATTTPGNSDPKPTTPKPNQGQSTVHMVFCQKAGSKMIITKGSSSSDNKNRVQVGVWNEHERGEGWNQARAEQEFLSKCNVVSVPATPVTPTETPKPGMGNATPAPVASAVTTPTAPKPVATISAAVTELPQTGSFGATAIILGLMTTIAAYGITYVLQSKQS